MRKQHLTRLQKLVVEWTDHERNMQAKHGDAVPGSCRSVQRLDAEALQAALAMLYTHPDLKGIRGVKEGD